MKAGRSPFIVRQDEARRPDDMRRDAKQHFPFSQRLPHEAEFVIFEIAQPAMNELARRRRCRAGKIALLAEHHRKAAPGGVARDPGAIDAAADDEEIDRCVRFHATMIAKGLRDPVNAVTSLPETAKRTLFRAIPPVSTAPDV